jgi:hypothetical protein
MPIIEDVVKTKMSPVRLAERKPFYEKILGKLKDFVEKFES